MDLQILAHSHVIRVAAVEPSGALYGSEYCLLDILTGLNTEQFNWHVITVPGAGFDRLLTEHGIEFSAFLRPHLHLRNRLQKIGTYLRLFRHLRRLRPDLIYLNQAGFLRPVAWISKRLRIPIVCQVQTLEDAHMVSKGPELHAQVQAFVCNSQFIADQTQVDAARKCVLYQGIATQPSGTFASVVQNRNHSAPRIGILGRIAHSKGHYLLLDAAKELIRELPSCRFVVIGAGLTARDTDLFERAVQRSSLSEHFEMRGYQADLKTELSRLDLLVIPSLAEPLGRVLFDAARYRIPVVVSNAGGLGEICRHFGVGEVFESGHPQALAKAILLSLQNLPAVREKFVTTSSAMLQRLRMSSYLTCIEQILIRARKAQPSKMMWFGDEE